MMTKILQEATTKIDYPCHIVSKRSRCMFQFFLYISYFRLSLVYSKDQNGNSLECPFENVLGRNVLLFFVLSIVYVCKDEKQKDISSEDIFRKTFLTVFVLKNEKHIKIYRLNNDFSKFTSMEKNIYNT